MGRGAESAKQGMAKFLLESGGFLAVRAASLMLNRVPAGEAELLLGLEKKWGRSPEPREPMSRQKCVLSTEEAACFIT